MTAVQYKYSGYGCSLDPFSDLSKVNVAKTYNNLSHEIIISRNNIQDIYKHDACNMHPLIHLLQSTYINELMYGEQFEQFAIVIMAGCWNKFFSNTIHLCLPTLRTHQNECFD